MARPVPRLVYASVFLLASSTLMLEIALTRVFSVLTWHHFTHLIVAIGMLGFGAAGSYLTARPVASTDDEGRPPHLILARWAWLYAIAIVVSFLVATRIMFEPLRIAADPTQLIALAIYQAVLAVPFFFAGLCLASLVKGYRERIHAVYFADLGGAAVGSIASLGAIATIGAPATIFLSAVLAGTAAVLLRKLATEVPPKLTAPLLGLLSLVLLLAGTGLEQPYLVHSASSKELSLRVNPSVGTGQLAWTSWHPTSRIDVTTPLRGRLPGFGGAISKRFSDVSVEGREVFQDGAAPTAFLQSNGDLASMGYLGGFMQGAPYVLRGKANALVIGVGGGIDVLIALHHGARHVTGAELNPLMVHIATSEFAEYSGNFLQRPDVTIVTSEGRHFLSRDNARFDVIQLSGVDTFAALSSGAYALAENYLYTSDAIDAMREHLTPDGILSISRFIFKPPRETLRLACTMISTMEARGVERPWEHVFIMRGTSWADTLMKRTPFTREEIDILHAWSDQLGFSVVFNPFEPGTNEFDAALRVNRQERDAFFSSYVFEVRPTTDDQPFFFNYYKWSDLFKTRTSVGGYMSTDFPLALRTLASSLVEIGVLAVIGILAPLYGRKVAPGVRRSSVLTYFGALGLGFMFVEITAVQKLMVFLGGPTYSLAITLSAMLLFSGLGSLWSQRWVGKEAWALPRVGVACVVFIGVLAVALDFVVPRALSLVWPARAALGAVLVAPSAFVLGMPFPLGIAVLGRSKPEWIPWAWATNSFMTVFGPLLCIFLAMQLGFRGVFGFAAVIYIVGFVVFRPVVRDTDSADSAGAESAEPAGS